MGVAAELPLSAGDSATYAPTRTAQLEAGYAVYATQ